MAVLRRNSVISQQRVDVPFMRSIESAVSADFDDMFNCVMTAELGSYVVTGFELNMTGAIGSAANSLQMLTADSAMLHGASEVSGTFFIVPSTDPVQVLSSITNPHVSGSFTPNTLNYVGLELIRTIDDSTTGPVYIWDVDTKSEIVTTAPLAQTLFYQIIITTSSFAANVLPVALISTDAANNVLSVTDQRPMLFRLGTAGFNSPNPFYRYPWTNQPEGRLENPFTSTNSSVNPFEGGDKMITCQKEWMNAIMSRIVEITGDPYWYTKNQFTLNDIALNLSNSTVSGTGTIDSDMFAPGQINWSSDIFLNLLGSNVSYDILPNPTSADITLADNQVAYIHIIRDIDIIPNLIFINGSPTVTSVGAVPWTSGLMAGDYVKDASQSDAAYYKILTVNSTSQVTLTTNFTGSSTGSAGIHAQYAWGVYSASATPTTDRFIHITSIANMPFGADYVWLFYRKDNGSPTAQIYVNFGIGFLAQGEFKNINGESEFAPFFEQLRIIPFGASSPEVRITGANAEQLNGITLSQSTKNLLLNFTGATVNFSTGIVLASDNSTPLGINFTPVTIPTDDYQWYSITLVASTVNADNTINAQVQVLPGSSSNAVLANAPKAPFANGIPLGQVWVQNDGASSVDPISYANIIQLGIGSGSGSGSGGIIATYYDPISTSLPTGATVTIDGNAGVNGDTVLYSSLASGNNEIYQLNGVGTSITWTLQRDFENGALPVAGESVRFAKGVAFATFEAVFDGTTFTVNNIVRYFNGADYWETTSLKTLAIANNSTGTMFTVGTTGSENIIVNYSIIRGITKDIGQFIITTTSGVIETSRVGANIGSTGVVLNATLSGPNTIFSYVSDNSGSTGTIKYFLNRWSDSPGGPGGVPTYSASSSSTSAAGIQNDIQFCGPTGLLDADNNFQWDPIAEVLTIGQLSISAMIGSITLLDNQSSPVTIITLPQASVKYIVLEYSISRNLDTRVGTMKITQNGTITSMVDEEIDTAGTGITNSEIVFSSSLSGSNLLIRYTTTSTGFNGTFKYSARKWI